MGNLGKRLVGGDMFSDHVKCTGAGSFFVSSALKNRFAKLVTEALNR